MPRSPAEDSLTYVLNRLERRRRGVVLMRGLGLALLVAAIGAALGIGLDAAFFLPQPVRWLLWCGWLGAPSLVLIVSLVRAFARPADALSLASKVERSDFDPASGRLESLTAAVALMHRPNGSPALIAALAEQAAALASEIDPARVIPGRRAVRSLMLGAFPFVLLVVPAIVAPDGPLRARLGRMFAPWANLGRSGAFALVVEPGNGRAALGSRPAIHVVVRGVSEVLTPPDDAWIEWREVEAGSEGTTRSRPQRLAMNGTRESGRFVATLPRLKGAVLYRAVVGSDEGQRGWQHLGLDTSTSASPWYRLDAAMPPAIVGLRARVEPPAYTRIPTSEKSLNESATIEARQESRIVLEIDSSSKLRSVAVGFESDPATGSGLSKPEMLPGTIVGEGRSAEVSLQAEMSGTLAVRLVDEAGIAAEEAPLVRLVVRNDAPPTVSVEELDRSGDTPIEARPDEVVRLDVTASDDFVVASAELRIEVERTAVDEPGGGASLGSGHPDMGKPARVPLSLPGLGARRVRGEGALALEPLGLRPGDRLTYRVRVADNRPAPRGPNVGWSDPRTIVIARRSDTLAQRRRAAARAAIQARLDTVKRETARLRQESEQLRYAADAARQGSGTWDEERQLALSGREADAGRLVDDLNRLADLLATPTDPRGRPDPEADFHTLAPAAREAAGREGESSRASLERARRARNAGTTAEASGHRLESLRQADSHLVSLAARLDEIQTRFDATKPKGSPGQGQGERGEGQSEVASQNDAKAQGEGGSEKGTPKNGAAGSGVNASATAGKGGGRNQAGQPGKAGSAPAGNTAQHEDSEAMAETGAADIATLRDAMRKRSGRAWAELPGQLRSRVLQMPQIRFRDEYTRQIERYYRELATGSRRPDE